MITIETKVLNMSKELKRKIDMVCRFTSTKAVIKNGSVRNIVGTNVAYAQPHKITINDINYLIFDESNKVFVNNLYTEIAFSELENHIKMHKYQ